MLARPVRASAPAAPAAPPYARALTTTPCAHHAVPPHLSLFLRAVLALEGRAEVARQDRANKSWVNKSARFLGLSRRSAKSWREPGGAQQEGRGNDGATQDGAQDGAKGAGESRRQAFRGARRASRVAEATELELVRLQARSADTAAALEEVDRMADAKVEEVEVEVAGGGASASEPAASSGNNSAKTSSQRSGQPVAASAASSASSASAATSPLVLRDVEAGFAGTGLFSPVSPDSPEPDMSFRAPPTEWAAWAQRTGLTAARAWLKTVARSQLLNVFITFMIIFNTATMALERWDNELHRVPPRLEEFLGEYRGCARPATPRTLTRALRWQTCPMPCAPTCSWRRRW